MIGYRTRLFDTFNRLLDERDLLALQAHIHPREQISSKTLQSGGGLPVREGTGITGH